MSNYSNLIILVVIFAARIFFNWRIVRGEDRRTLMDLDRITPKLFMFGINLILAAALTVLIIYGASQPFFLAAALGIVALFGLSQALLEKKYLPATRRHLATLLSFGVMIVAIAAYMLLVPQV
ncbi:hypothetical protein [Saccharibacillus qingshengii]|uniref:hypothetical protein n=1 Tax=Saccharibacillus qingshengii TaxID=1763540 RepID=UPI0015519E69|nr:hypothetical protein [Saccharibacillus qingshengii]